MANDQYRLGEAWKAFMLRTLVLTNPNLGVVSDHNVGVRYPPLALVASSLLFVDLISLLDQATSTQMTPERFELLGSFGRRLHYLVSAGKVHNPGALDALRRRRNEVAHSLMAVDTEELEGAMLEVHHQLRLWGLVPEMLRLELALDVETNDQGAHSVTLTITHEGLIVFSRTTEGELEKYEKELEKAIAFFGSTGVWPR